jgi:hypothetical protein
MPRNRGRQASGREDAAARVVADEAGELPPELADLTAPSPELASVGAGLLEAAELDLQRGRAHGRGRGDHAVDRSLRSRVRPLVEGESLGSRRLKSTA